MTNSKSLLGYFDAFISGISGRFGRSSGFLCNIGLVACLLESQHGYENSYVIQDVLSIIILFILFLIVGPKGGQFFDCFLDSFSHGDLFISLVFLVVTAFFWGICGIIFLFTAYTYFSPLNNVFSDNRELISNIGTSVFAVSILVGPYLYYRLIHLSHNAAANRRGDEQTQEEDKH